MGRQPLAIAAGMLLDVEDPAETVEVAASAGFDALGLRFVADPPTPATLRRILAALERTGLYLLDLEMVVSTADGEPASTDPQVLELAAELAPRHLTTVSYHPDHARTRDRLGEVCESVGPAGVVPALEFLPFSGVRTLAAAQAIVEAVGIDRAAVLIDALHVQRSGERPEALAGLDRRVVPYVQFCDATDEPVDASDRGLYREAVAGRLLPGQGGLPLHRFLTALPSGTPLSVEVLSERLMTTMEPLARATAAREATEAVLAASAQQEVRS